MNNTELEEIMEENKTREPQEPAMTDEQAIPKELRFQQESIVELKETISELRGRLVPISKIGLPAELPEREATILDYSVGLNIKEHLREHRAEIKNLNAEVRYMIERLEI